MKKVLTLIVSLISALTATVSAQVADYKLNVQDFCELIVVDGIRVDCYCSPDSAGWAVFSCTPELAQHIMFSNNAQRLVIQTDAVETPITGVPRVVVYTANLRRVENSGDSLVRVFSEVPVKDFKVSQIGNGDVELHNIHADRITAAISAGRGTMLIDGIADKVSIRNVSAGIVNASALCSNEVKCFVLGPGNIHCASPEKLKIVGAGSGIVYYHGATPHRITNRGLGVKSMAYELAPDADRLLSAR